MGALEGKVAVVTGASRGIGEAIAIALADDGADLAVLARTQPDLEKTAAEVRESGRKACVVVCDVASIAGPVAFPRIGAYCAAKAGVVALTKVMAAEWAEHHIRVNAVAPGWIESPMNVELRTEPKNVEMFAHLRSQTFLKRFGRPREVADVVTFLASPAASYIDGEVIFIDGGWTAV